jgi:hypothetical protein
MLNFEKIEDCFPEHGALCAVDDRITVSAQWLHDFAHAVAQKEREACAIVCVTLWDLRDDERARMHAGKCANAIRKRSNAGAVQ